MKVLLSMIEALLRGEYDKDMRYQRMIGMTGDLLIASEDAEAELYAIDDEFAKMLIDGLYALDDLDEFDQGSPETIAHYKQMVSKIYNSALAILQKKGIKMPEFERCDHPPYQTLCPVYGEWIGRGFCGDTREAANDPQGQGVIGRDLRDRGMETALTPEQRKTCRACKGWERMFPNLGE